MLDLETVKNAKHAHQATVSDAGHNGLSVVDQVYVAVSAGVAGALGYFFVRIVALGLVVRIMEGYGTQMRATQLPGFL
jgi:hypothetical protein